MSQKQLAEASGYSRASIIRIEADQSDLPMSGAYAIADALGVPLGSLLVGLGPEAFPEGGVDRLKARQDVLTGLIADLLKQVNALQLAHCELVADFEKLQKNNKP